MAGFPFKALAAVVAALCLQALFWSQTRDLRAGLEEVPPAPSPAVANALALGDHQFLYRTTTFALQNLGDEGGRVTPLKDYDYQRLGRWFSLLDQFDPRSNYLPVLVGHYFSQSPEPDHVRVVIAYLSRIALREPAQNWRWLAHAVYLARHKVKDLGLALNLAYRLAALEAPGMPIWTRQMPAFVLAEVGDKEAARDLMEAILESDPNLAAGEIDFMREFIDTRLQ